MYAGDERNPRLEIAAHESLGAVFQLKLYQPAENSVNAEGGMRANFPNCRAIGVGEVQAHIKHRFQVVCARPWGYEPNGRDEWLLITFCLPTIQPEPTPYATEANQADGLA
jgi:hypothetical protein